MNTTDQIDDTLDIHACTHAGSRCCGMTSCNTDAPEFYLCYYCVCPPTVAEKCRHAKHQLVASVVNIQATYMRRNDLDRPNSTSFLTYFLPQHIYDIFSAESKTVLTFLVCHVGVHTSALFYSQQLEVLHALEERARKVLQAVPIEDSDVARANEGRPTR